MKRYPWILVAVIAAGAGYWWLDSSGSAPEGRVPEAGTFMRDGQEWVRFSDPEVDIAFEYRQEPDGYILLTPAERDTASDAPAKNWALLRRSDYEELQRSESPREGPPSINIQAFNPGPNITPDEWAAQHPGRSNFRPDTELTWVQVDGNAAVRYSWDGLYPGETVVFARKGWVYMLSVTYLEPDTMLTDFDALLDSLEIQDF